MYPANMVSPRYPQKTIQKMRFLLTVAEDLELYNQFLKSQVD